MSAATKPNGPLTRLLSIAAHLADDRIARVLEFAAALQRQQLAGEESPTAPTIPAPPPEPEEGNEPAAGDACECEACEGIDEIVKRKELVG